MGSSFRVDENSMANVRTLEPGKSAHQEKRSGETTAKAVASTDRVQAAVKRRLAVLSSPDAPERLRAAFNATPTELAQAANAAERRRKR